MTIHECDFCGQTSRTAVMYSLESTYEFNDSCEYDNSDICHDCLTKFKKYLGKEKLKNAKKDTAD